MDEERWIERDGRGEPTRKVPTVGNPMASKRTGRLTPTGKSAEDKDGEELRMLKRLKCVESAKRGRASKLEEENGHHIDRWGKGGPQTSPSHARPGAGSEELPDEDIGDSEKPYGQFGELKTRGVPANELQAERRALEQETQSLKQSDDSATITGGVEIVGPAN